MLSILWISSIPTNKNPRKPYIEWGIILSVSREGNQIRRKYSNIIFKGGKINIFNYEVYKFKHMSIIRILDV